MIKKSSSSKSKVVIIASSVIIILFVLSLTVLGKRNDYKSQCYTDLQPSSFINSYGLPDFRYNSVDKYFKLSFPDKNLDYDVSQVRNTGSMRPALSDNSFIIELKNPSKDEIEVGDIISFECNNKNIIHRVIDMQDDVYITKGDNNNVNDLAIGCITSIDEINSKVIGVLY